jgi:hypothetical protein
MIRLTEHSTAAFTRVATFQDFQANSLMDDLVIHFRREIPIDDVEFILEQMCILLIVVCL